MKNFTMQMLLLAAGAIFLIKGGFGMLAAAWRFALPMVLIGGGYYLVKKALKSGMLSSAAQGASEKVRAAPQNESDVIEICPHCLSEVGSCPKCRKAKKG